MKLYQLAVGTAAGAIAFAALLSPTSLAPSKSEPRAESSSSQTQPFQVIPHPLHRHLLVTAGGFGLIVWELWWFSGPKPKRRQTPQKTTISLRQRLGR